MERLDPYHLSTTKLNPLIRKYHQSTGIVITLYSARVFYDFMTWLAEQRAADQQKKEVII